MEVQGKIGMGTGFVVYGTARFLSEGADYEMMKVKHPFLTRVMEVTASSVCQTI